MMPVVVLLDNSKVSAQAPWKPGLAALACEVSELAAAGDTHRYLNLSRPVLLILPVADRHQILGMVRLLRQKHRTVPIVLAVSEGSEDLAVAAFRIGVSDYFRIPGEEKSLLEVLRRLLTTNDAEYPGREQSSETTDAPFIGDSPPMRAVKSHVARIAGSNSNVLITGETGTGKELVASAIHRMSARHHGPFVCVNCAAIPDSLLESELFGYERGAFTGAQCLTAGWLESSHHGTMFLDEIGDLSLLAQAKLLRVIENKGFHRLGGKKDIRVDVRFIAATNRDLEEMASDNRFRWDLYYRLNIVRVHLPPLRERKEDIPSLLRHYVRELNTQNPNRMTEMTDEVWNCLMDYDWPGNIRELKNVLESIFVSSAPGTISFEHLPEPFRKRLEKGVPENGDERQQLVAALLGTKWNKSKAAEQLRWSRMTLYRKMHKYHLFTARS